MRDLNIRASYTYQVNPYYMETIRDIDNPNIRNTSYFNRKSGKSYFISADYNKDLFKWWNTSFYVGFGGADYKYTATDGSTKNNNSPIWYLNMNNTIYLP